MNIRINYEEMVKRDLIMSLSNHDKVLWASETLKHIEFWKSGGYFYNYQFSIHLDDMYKVIEAMEHCERLYEKELPANMDLHYCLVPKNYLGHYYYMKSSCNNFKFSNSKKGLENINRIYLPINSKLWRDRLSILPVPKVNVEINVNGKRVNEPLSYETAKRLGIIK